MMMIHPPACIQYLEVSVEKHYLTKQWTNVTEQKQPIHYHTAQNFSRFRTARKLVEKILVADHTNNSSLFELTTFGR